MPVSGEYVSQTSGAGHSGTRIFLSANGVRSIARRYPVALLSGILSIGLIAGPAIVFGNPEAGIILLIVGVSIGSSFLTELTLDASRKRQASKGPKELKPIPSAPVWIILTIGVLADSLSILGGARSYSVQLGESDRSGWVGYLTPFSIWSLAGLLLVMWLWKTQRITPARGALVVAAVCVLKVALGLNNGIVGASAAFVFTVAVSALWLELVRFRFLLVIVGTAVAMWPTIFEYRNSLRAAVTGRDDSGENPFDRLRLDEQMANVVYVMPRPAILEPPTWLTIIRTGLLPSALDPDRPPIDVGTRFSLALGGSELSSTSATLLGNILVFAGWSGLIIFSVLISVVLVLLLRGRVVWCLILAALLYLYCLSFAASYPIAIVRVLQGVQSLIAMVILFKLLSVVLCGADTARVQAPAAAARSRYAGR